MTNKGRMKKEMTSPLPRRLDFSDVALYGVTSFVNGEEALLTQVDGLLDGGVDAIQLRASTLSDRSYVAFGKKIQERCQAEGSLFIVNNRADLMLALDADGVHIGHNDLPVAAIREMIGHRKIIGVSTHSLPEAIAAQKAGADYVSCGPVWATPTKPDYPAVGLNLVGLYRAALRIPFVAIGGVNEANIDEVLTAGARCVAVVRALFEAKDPAAVAKNLKSKVLLNRKSV